MIGLGKPVRLCPRHVAVLECPRRCLGVQLSELAELYAASEPGCAVCKLAPRQTRPFQILRKCGDRRCYARFHKVSYDDLRVDEWRQVWRSQISRLSRLIARRR